MLNKVLAFRHAIESAYRSGLEENNCRIEIKIDDDKNYIHMSCEGGGHTLSSTIAFRKYVLCPRYIVSSKDEDRWYISANKLVRLYGVRPIDCVVVEGGILLPENRYYLKEYSSLKWLHPRQDGNYSLEGDDMEGMPEYVWEYNEELYFCHDCTEIWKKGSEEEHRSDCPHFVGDKTVQQLLDSSETRERWIWYLKQLLPFKYVSIYKEDGVNKVTIFNMWFGRCFNSKTTEIGK